VLKFPLEVFRLILCRAVYLYPRYTFDNREAISKFSLRLQYEIDKSKTDLTKGCPKPYRYLDSDRDPKFANITAISLLRSGSSQSVPEGWDGMFDLNKNRGSEFLYLVWRRMPTSVTTILPHRFVKDIVVCPFNLSTLFLLHWVAFYRLNSFPTRRR
jgi:hypothetical protein